MNKESVQEWKNRGAAKSTPRIIVASIWLLIVSVFACWTSYICTYFEPQIQVIQDAEGVTTIALALDRSMEVLGLLILSGLWLFMSWMLYRRRNWVRYAYCFLSFICFMPLYLTRFIESLSVSVNTPSVMVMVMTGYMAAAFFTSACLLLLPLSADWFNPAPKQR
jgi:hypothetical protein